MIRRSLRIGIRLGLLGGLAFALFKIVEARRPLPAEPSGDWVPTWAPAPSPTPPPEPVPAPPAAVAPDEPTLVEPTMLRSTSLKRPSTGTDDRSFDLASTAPPVVPPADPFAPAAPPVPTLVPATAAEIEPDDDEIVILSTAEDGIAAAPGTSTAEPPSAAGAAGASARTAAPRAAPPRKAAANKAAPPTKATARKATTKTAATKKAATKKAAARKATTRKAAAKKTAPAGGPAWVEPEGDVCPTSHPVKAKLRSAIFHLPGMAAYARTSPDRCYRDESAAASDGLRKAAR